MTQSLGVKVAVLDDEARMAEVVGMLLRREGYEVAAYSDPRALLAELEREPVDLLLTDLRMPELDGVEVLTRARALWPELPVILLTAHATVKTAVAAIRQGAYDYVQKPFDNAELKALVARALDHSRLSRENQLLRGVVAGGELLVAESAPMRRLLGLVRRVAPTRSTVLVTGESGTGKEVVARALHRASDRSQRPFVALNVKALSPSLLEAELFGHEKGAFTGAERRKPGVFERAEGGTLFLDEIGEIDGDVQAKLLRVLQEREVQPLGALEPLAVDARLIAATNRDLEAEVAAGRFREDLFFRLHVIPLRVAPLRERREDVLPLARAFLRRVARDVGRVLEGWTPEVEAWLLSHAWPGNVRELQNVIERGAVLAESSRLELADLTLEPAEEAQAEAPVNLSEFLDRAAAAHIQGVLDEVEGKRVEAARRLGVDRTTLYRLIKKHGLGSD